MPRGLRYATTLWLSGAATYAAITFAFLNSIKVFEPQLEEGSFATAETPTEIIGGPVAISELVGAPTDTSRAEALHSDLSANDQAPTGKEWIEVQTAVNMRSGPSGSKPILTVQPKGAALMVLSRKQSWVEVAEPESKLRGWVFSRFVKDIEPRNRQASAIEWARDEPAR